MAATMLLFLLLAPGPVDGVGPDDGEDTLYCRVCWNGYTAAGFNAHALGTQPDGFWKAGLLDLQPHGDHNEVAWEFCGLWHYACGAEGDFDADAVQAALETHDGPSLARMLDRFPERMRLVITTRRLEIMDCRGTVTMSAKLSDMTFKSLDTAVGGL